MKYCIDTEVLKANNLTLPEFLLLWLSGHGIETKELKKSLLEKDLVVEELFSTDKLPSLGPDIKDLIANMIIDSTPEKESSTKVDFYTDLAECLRDIFPRGKKEGTSYMWRDSVSTIARRLKLLNVKYGHSFTKEQAINAAQAYVRSFNGDYRYMQLLKYFILKVPINANGDVEVRSELMSYIENEGQEDINNAWLNELK